MTTTAPALRQTGITQSFTARHGSRQALANRWADPATNPERREQVAIAQAQARRAADPLPTNGRIVRAAATDPFWYSQSA